MGETENGPQASRSGLVRTQKEASQHGTRTPWKGEDGTNRPGHRSKQVGELSARGGPGPVRTKNCKVQGVKASKQDTLAGEGGEGQKKGGLAGLAGLSWLG
jgi:hypothetical protein